LQYNNNIYYLCHMTGIYKIESKTNPKRCYFGSAIDINTRWKRHLMDLNRNKHHSIKLQRHYNKYGESDLLFTVLLCCMESDLLKNEQYYIESYESYFNICKIAGNCSGVCASEKTREKISISSIGRKNRLGMKNSDESNKKRSKSLMGNKNSMGFKNRLNKKHSAETLIKMRKPRTIKWKLSEETKRKQHDMAIKNKNKPPSQLGLKRSEEIKQKMRKPKKRNQLM